MGLGLRLTLSSLNFMVLGIIFGLRLRISNLNFWVLGVVLGVKVKVFKSKI
jgi:hypothetical protein